MLPNQLESLAGDVGAFISCLSEFEEFNDEAISQSMRTFEGDLKVCHVFFLFDLSWAFLMLCLICSTLRLVSTNTSVRIFGSLPLVFCW